MITKHFLLIPLLCLLMFKAKVQEEVYENTIIEGYSVYVEKEAFSKDSLKTTEAIHLLTTKLQEINTLEFSSEIRSNLKKVKIFMDWDMGGGAAVYHPSKEWLIENGYPSYKEKSIEISNIGNFLNWTTLNQPYMVLHEMAHAYHDQFLSTEEKMRITNVFNLAMEKELYNMVSYNGGGSSDYPKRKAYATNNNNEYFAELTEAFFGLNDYYPFTRKELKTHDKAGYELLVDLWLKE